MMAIIAPLIIAGTIFVVGMVKHWYPSYKDDNPIEELVEVAIKEKTGIDVDLTPFSPENK